MSFVEIKTSVSSCGVFEVEVPEKNKQMPKNYVHFKIPNKVAVSVVPTLKKNMALLRILIVFLLSLLS